MEGIILPYFLNKVLMNGLSIVYNNRYPYPYYELELCLWNVEKWKESQKKIRFILFIIILIFF